MKAHLAHHRLYGNILWNDVAVDLADDDEIAVFRDAADIRIGANSQHARAFRINWDTAPLNGLSMRSPRTVFLHSRVLSSANYGNISRSEKDRQSTAAILHRLLDVLRIRH